MNNYEHPSKRQLLSGIHDMMARLTRSHGPGGPPDAEQALLQAAQPYRLLTETLREGAALLAPDLVVLCCNLRLAEMLQLNADQIIGQSLREFVPAQDIAPLEQLQSSHPGAAHTIEVKLHGGNALPLPVELTFQKLSLQEWPVINVVAADLRERQPAPEPSDFDVQLLANLRDAVITTNKELVVTGWNRAAEQLYGWKADDALGRPVSQLTRTEYARGQERQALRSLAETGHYEAIVSQRRRDGRRIVVEKNVFALRRSDGHVIGYVGVNRDLTDWKQAEHALRESEAHYHQFFERSLAGVYRTLLDPQTLAANRIDCNDAHAHILGYGSRAELLNQPVRPIFFSEAEWKTYVQDLLTHRELTNHELRLKRKDGSPVWVLLNAGLRDSETPGRFLIEGTLIDITARKQVEEKIRLLNAELEQRVNDRTSQLLVANAGLEEENTQRRWAEQALRESEARYRQLVELSPDGIAVHRDGKVAFVNSAAAKLVGAATPQELIGRPILDFVHPDYHAIVRERARAASEGGQAAGLLEEKFVRLDGRTLDVEVASIPCTYQGQPAVQVVIRDITQRKQAEEKVKQLNRDLEQRAAELASANEELEAFSYSVSHDLRAPLAAIQNMSRLFLEEHGDRLGTAARQTVELIHNNALGMDELIRGLLAFSRTSRQPLTLRTVCHTELVQHVWDELVAQQTGRRLELVLGDLPDCRADPMLLKQVWSNLISNAIKFTSKRAVARIEVGSGKWEVSKVGNALATLGTLGTSNPSTSLRAGFALPVYFVRDNGAGFEMREASKLFGVFRRLHSEEEYAGTGVGLAIVERIVRRHGGRVWAEAEVDKGATFYFTLARESGD
ncbi:MAG: PAS domain S-box protein [Chloroflexi bacterium]|nr:PAS domain S-box protein [Chloroflexota bacterium]